MNTKRNVTISLQYDPSISGFGGYDEYQVGPLPPEYIDLLNEKILRAVKDVARKAKVSGGYTGVS